MGALAAATVAALTAAVRPTTTAVAADGKPASAWGTGGPHFKMPAVKVGANRPVKSRPVKTPSDAAYLPWLRQQRAHAKAPASAAQAPVMNFVPEGQGDVPWHRSTSFAIIDALTARIDYLTGNLMLTAPDFDVAGVGQQLRLARTYNSLDAPYGQVSQRWWQQYERYLSVSSS